MKVSRVGMAVVYLAMAAFLPACNQEAKQSLPSGAIQVSQGDKVISYTAPHDGKVYLRDDTSNTVVYSADVRAGQSVKYDPEMKQAMVNGTVANIPNANHDHSWYFERSGLPDRADPNAQPGNNQSSNSNGGMTTVHVPIGVQVDVTRPSQP